jgi:putative addiction module component (TIGR02574 family)
MASRKIDFSHLTPAERIELIEALWDSLDPQQAVPLTPELVDELERRSAEAEANPEAGRTWEEIRADLEKSFVR